MPQEAKNSATIWSITAQDGSEFTFHSTEELLKFAEAENEAWNWVRSSASQSLRDAMQGAISPLKSAIAMLRNTDKPYVMQSDDRALAHFSTYLAFKPALHSRAPLQGFISDLRARKNQHEATAALGWLLRAEGRLQSFEPESIPATDLAAGVAEAVIWRRGLAPQQKAADVLKHLEKMRKEGAQLLERVAAAVASSEQGALQMQAMEQSAHETNAQLHRDLKGQTDQLVESLRAEWKQLTATYDDKLALNAPSTYWSTKAKDHKKMAIGFGIASGLFAVVGGIVMWVLLASIFGSQPVGQLPAWAQVLPVTVAALLYLWALKTLIRLTMSHVHLMLDSSERRVMIMSYLALSRRREVSAEERSAMFAAIFRPSGDGIVKDENPPLPMLEFLRGSKN